MPPEALHPPLSQIGQHVRQRREQLGLTQARLGALAGLSRATINEIESGQIADLGIAKVMRLLALLGLELSIAAGSGGQSTHARRSSAVATAARTASTSYRTALPPQTLAKALRTGDIPEPFRPHFATLLDEASPTLILRAAEEVLGPQIPRRAWRTIARWAEDLQSTQQVWRQ
jgi:transcriptional regulator with XRE-family HTH domain